MSRQSGAGNTKPERGYWLLCAFNAADGILAFMGIGAGTQKQALAQARICIARNGLPKGVRPGVFHMDQNLDVVRSQLYAWVKEKAPERAPSEAGFARWFSRLLNEKLLDALEKTARRLARGEGEDIESTG